MLVQLPARPPQLLSIMSAMWKKLSNRSPASGKGVRLIGLVVYADISLKLVTSPSRLALFVCLPWCREFRPEKASGPSAALFLNCVVEPTTCTSGQRSPVGQWMCQSMSLSGSARQPGSCGGTRYPEQPIAVKTFRPPWAVPTVYPNVSLGTPARPSLKSTPSPGLLTVQVRRSFGSGSSAQKPPTQVHLSLSTSKFSNRIPSSPVFGRPSGPLTRVRVAPTGRSRSSSVLMASLLLVPRASRESRPSVNSPVAGSAAEVVLVAAETW